MEEQIGYNCLSENNISCKNCFAIRNKGSMSIVGAGFPEFRSIAVFGGVFLFAWKKSNLWHGKQTFKHPPCF